MDFPTLYNHPKSVPESNLGRSLTRQDMARECDINYIVARAGAGELVIPPAEPLFCDLSEVPSDYAEMMAKLGDAQEKFYSLPSKVRDRFGSDPHKLFGFLADSNNRDEAVRLGLVPPPPKPPVEAKAE